MSTPGTIAHRTLLTGVNNPAYQVSKDVWNAAMVVASAAPDGAAMVRDSAQPDGWGFSDGAAVVTTDARLSDARVPLAHVHAPADVTGTAVVTADPRLSDARVPLAHAHAFASLLALPTTLAGFGITDAVPSARTINGQPLSANVALTKGDVGLGAVENLALSTWAGSAALTTTGIIGAGTWRGTAVAPGFGGTGLGVYAVGDLLYASGVAALARLPASAAVGAALVSGGAGAAPAYSPALTSTATLMTAGSSAGVMARIGEGRPCGNPSNTPSAVADGAGVLTGTYRYAYFEVDPTGPGTTGLSPLSTAVTLTANKALVTVPLPRRGMGGRTLCRTKAGGSTFYVVGTTLNGMSFYQTQWPDNTPDAGLTVLAPTVDTTILYSFETNPYAPKFVRTHPDAGNLPADFAPVTGDPYTPGAYSIDCYGTVIVRGGPNSNTFMSQTTGTGANQYHLICFNLPAQNDGTGTAFVGPQVFGVIATGETMLAVPGNLTTRPAMAIAATMPTTEAGTTVAGMTLTITGAGTVHQTQRALAVTLAAGYTGAGVTFGATVANASVTAGAIAGSVGLQASAIGGSPTNVGVQAIAAGGTANVGVFAGLGAALAGVAAGYSACVLANNGATSASLFVGLNNSALVFYVTAAGLVTANGGATFGGGVSVTGTISASNNVQAGAAAYITWNGRTALSSPADGQMNLTKQSTTIGVGLDFVTDAILKVRTRAQTGYATVDALGYSVSGAAGASKAAGPVSSITVVNGIVTAIS